MSRTKNSFYNLATSLSTELISLVLKFVVRTIFIYQLGVVYLGINSLIMNLISLLSLTELGFGTAITFHLYKPLNKGDEKKIRQLLLFFKHTYFIIGIIILCLGLLLLPTLNIIIAENTLDISVHIIFLLYLVQTVSSYLFYAFKHTLIRAHQKEYVINNFKTFFSILSSVLQITIILLTRNFYLFVGILILTNFIMNISIARYAEIKYKSMLLPDNTPLDKNEKKELYFDSISIVFYKLYDKITGSLGNVFLTAFAGLYVVGLFSNYMLIFSTIIVFLSKIYSAIVSSLSDLKATENNDNLIKIFNFMNFITFIIFGFVSIVTYFVLDLFIEVWIGSAYLFTEKFKILFSINLLLTGYKLFFDLFRTSLGLFQKAKFRPIIGIVINVILSYLLIKRFGVIGLLSASIFTNIATFFWYDPLIIIKYGIFYDFKKYFFTNVIYFSCLVFTFTLTYFIVSKVSIHNDVLHLIVRFLIASFISFSVLLITNIKSSNLSYGIEKVKYIIRKGKKT